MVKFEGPLFLVGLPRSGTKLLRGLLNGHSRVSIPLNETEFLPHWLNNWSDFGDLSTPAAFEAFYARVSRSRYFTHRLDEHGKRIPAAVWSSQCKSFTPQAVFEALIRHDAAVPNDAIWGDKSPGYISHLPLLKAAFPRARFIHIIRDVRDYSLSINHAFGKSKIRAAQRWNDSISSARQAAQALGNDYIEVLYEKLLDDPQRHLQLLCDFVGIDFEPGMLQLSFPTENIGIAKGQRQIMQKNVEKWRTKMPDKERILIEQISGNLLRSLGYPVSESSTRTVSKFRMLALQAHDGFQLTKTEASRRGWFTTVQAILRSLLATRSL